uniref:Transformation-related protein 4 n=1 Tax=Homo sapiens TaxID=9606 RepID=Q56VW5_HUMAN|nr:transformation-related protein 4 [Homo sapiens]
MTQKVWSSPGDRNPSGKSLQGPCLETMGSLWRAAAWRGLTWASISPHIGVRPAEASPGSWWNPTGRSRRQARTSRSSSLVQTGRRSPSNSTSVRCPGSPSPTRMRPGGRASTGCTESKASPRSSCWTRRAR